MAPESKRVDPLRIWLRSRRRLVEVTQRLGVLQEGGYAVAISQELVANICQVWVCPLWPLQDPP